MNKTAPTSVEIHPLVAERWSPRSFDEQASLSDNDVLALLEAGRWAPSANNSQPWRFAVVRRGDSEFATVKEALVGFNQQWAPRAAAFIAVGAETTDEEGKPRKWALYDTGIASGFVTLQAQALGLHVHQMGGFNPEGIHDALGFNERTQLMAVMAIGRRADATQLSDELRAREEGPRQRNELSEIVVHGLPTVG